MVRKREPYRKTQDFQLVLTHSDIVNLMNDADVLLDGGHVLTTQQFTVILRKANGSEIQLREMEETDSVVFSYTKVTDTDSTASYSDIDIIA